MTYRNSKVEIIDFFNRKIHVKRDDLLSEKFSGNKARKLYYYLNEDLKFNQIVSFGSMQSNNMLSLSELARIKGVGFTYYVNRTNDFINKHSNEANLKVALNNGMKIVSIEDDEYIKIKEIIDLNKGITDLTLYIVEGGAQEEAEVGIKILAKEIEEYAEENNIKKLKVFLPSGTGSSALYLQQNLKFEVYTTPIVGKEEYLNELFNEINSEYKKPTIINTQKNYRYGKLYLEQKEIIEKLKNDTDIQFEYIYDPKGFLSIEENIEEFKDYELLYIHCGGIVSNELMEKRYKEKFSI